MGQILIRRVKASTLKRLAMLAKDYGVQPEGLVRKELEVMARRPTKAEIKEFTSRIGEMLTSYVLEQTSIDLGRGNNHGIAPIDTRR